MLTVLRHPRMRIPFSAAMLATGRACLALLVERFKPKAAVLPWLSPEGVVLPLMTAKLPLRFYRLAPDLSPDLDSLSEAISITEKPLVIVSHLFGYDMPTEDAADLTHERGGALLEDCAHALIGLAGGAQRGDFVLYSIDKFLACIGGGILQSRMPDVDVSFTPTQAIPENAVAAYIRHLDANACIGVTRRESDIQKLLVKSSTAYDDWYAIMGRDMTPRRPHDSASHAYKNCNREAFTARREENAAAWTRHDLLYRQGFPAFALPIRCNGRRDEIRQTLLSLGVVTSSIGDKWILPHNQFPVERDFINDHLLLPIGEGMTPEHMRRIQNVIPKCAF